MSLRKVYDCLQILREIPGRKDKERVFKKFCANVPYFSEVVIYTLDPLTRYYTKSLLPFGPSRNLLLTKDKLFQSGIVSKLFNKLNHLSAKKSANHKDIIILSMLSSGDIKSYKVVERIIKKDLDCGVGMATATKFIEDLYEYPVSLCYEATNKRLEKFQLPCIGQVKEDAGRINIQSLGIHTYFIARSGAPVYLNDTALPLPGMFNKISNLNTEQNGGTSIVYDGEIIFLDRYGTPLPRKQTNGKLTKGIRGTLTKAEQSRVRFVLWDVIPYQAFLNRKYSLRYSARLDVLRGLVSTIDPDGNFIKVVESKWLDTIEDIVDYFKEVRQLGIEGLVLKNPETGWEPKRSVNNLKFTVFQSDEEINECDLLCVGYNEHSKKHGQIGSLPCQSKDGGIVVNVGQGFSEKDRKRHFSNYVGKIITVRFKDVIESENKDELSLYLPIYQVTREDKTEADSTERIVKAYEDKHKQT